jgi:hypothetical protein
MAGKIYISQPVEIEITITVDGVKMSTGVSGEIRARKPNGTVTTWEGVIDNNDGKITYSATDGDITMSGLWLLQPVVELAGIPSITLPGETVIMTVYERFE